MKIGVDIDDTITNSWPTLSKEYSKVLGISEYDLIKDKPYYSKVIQEKYTMEEYFKKITPINDKINPILPIKDNVKEVIDKLYELGHTITFITARGLETTDPYGITKKFLEDNNKLPGKIINQIKEVINDYLDILNIFKNYILNNLS